MSAETTKREATFTIERTYRASIVDVWALWTTKSGFESWWGPQGFRVEVQQIDARVGGALHYEMIADSPEMIAAMKQMGQPISHPTRSRFSEVNQHVRLVLTNDIDFIPGVPVYENKIAVDFASKGDRVQMVATLHAMHDEAFTKMQKDGFASQLTKLDARFE
jgi:uncharacterized protein YndB with AHSA1/START domain